MSTLRGWLRFQWQQVCGGLSYYSLSRHNQVPISPADVPLGTTYLRMNGCYYTKMSDHFQRRVYPLRPGEQVKPERLNPLHRVFVTDPPVL